LLAADRVDAKESLLRSLLTLRPDNPITETGVLSEFSRHGPASRIGRHRADVGHHLLDPILVGAPWVASGYLVYRLVKRVRSRHLAPKLVLGRGCQPDEPSTRPEIKVIGGRSRSLT
jgi:hypothetical protein